MLLKDKNLYATVYGGNSTNPGTTTEADEHIALALALAYNTWHVKHYLTDARNILADIWDHETATVQDTRYIIAGDWAKGGSALTISPAALMPFAYRVFDSIDSSHDWGKLVDSSYQLLSACTEAPLNTNGTAHVPPNWCVLTNHNTITAATIDAHASDYSYDAHRVILYTALDYLINGNIKAKQYLEKMTLWKEEWQKHNAIYSAYDHDGTVLGKTESMAQYGVLLAYFSVVDRTVIS